MPIVVTFRDLTVLRDVVGCVHWNRWRAQMTKLLEKYRVNKTLKIAQAIRAYGRKHPFSACLLRSEDADLMADAIHHANKGA